jgi:hypothetical protein
MKKRTSPERWLWRWVRAFFRIALLSRRDEWQQRYQKQSYALMRMESRASLAEIDRDFWKDAARHYEMQRDLCKESARRMREMHRQRTFSQNA